VERRKAYEILWGDFKGNVHLETENGMGDDIKIDLKIIRCEGGDGRNRLSIVLNDGFGSGTAELSVSGFALLVTSTLYLDTFCQINSTE
jgi:hypothetical protein